ncbi:MAG: uroporphyrinogen-III C-methyltransferase [Chthonomonadales bacterium]
MTPSTPKPGKVYLVGAGPGDPGLITVKGAHVLSIADVVIYDRLAHPDHLRRARPDAELIYVGKQADRHTLKQVEINDAIVDRALKGLVVCRLKGGDPFVFGRGGEEAEECVANGIPFEIVPGVTSAIAAPAYAGIPVTHRDAASSFAVITGHERDDRRESGERTGGEAEGRRNWANIANAADTLIFLMGVENLSEIVAQLIKHGRAADTPIALVRWGTWAGQETLVSTLSKVVELVKNRNFQAPAVTIVGEVVRLREKLKWIESRPLFGKSIIVTRAREQSSGLLAQINELGGRAVEFPTIRIVPQTDYSDLDAAILHLADYNWVVFTSVNAVRPFKMRLRECGLDTRAFGKCRVAAIGPMTAEVLLKIGIVADYMPEKFVSESIIEGWPDAEVSGSRILIPRALEARDFLPDELTKRGAKVDVVAAYTTLPDSGNAEEIRRSILAGEIDYITFTSSSTVTNFVDAVGAENIPILRPHVRVACIGPITGDTAVNVGLIPDVSSQEHTIPGLLNAIIADIQSHSGGGG